MNLFPVFSTKEMIGTFSPQLEPYTHEMPEETAPSGFFARGSYTAKSKVCSPKFYLLPVRSTSSYKLFKPHFIMPLTFFPCMEALNLEVNDYDAILN